MEIFHMPEGGTECSPNSANQMWSQSAAANHVKQPCLCQGGGAVREPVLEGDPRGRLRCASAAMRPSPRTSCCCPPATPTGCATSSQPTWMGTNLKQRQCGPRLSELVSDGAASREPHATMFFPPAWASLSAFGFLGEQVRAWGGARSERLFPGESRSRAGGGGRGSGRHFR